MEVCTREKKKNGNAKSASPKQQPAIKRKSARAKRKEKAKKEVTRVEKEIKIQKLPSDDAGVSNSPGLKGAVQKIESNVSLEATRCVTTAFDCPVLGYTKFLAGWIINTIQSNPAAFDRGQGTDIYPKDLWMLGLLLLFSKVKRDGMVTGSGAGQLPNFDNLSVPIALGKILQYIGIYEKNGARSFFKVEFDINAAVGNSDVGPAQWSTNFPVSYDAMRTDSTGVYRTREGSTVSPNFGVWITDRLEDTMSRVAALANGGTVSGSRISKYAPNCTAYVIRTPGGTALQSQHDLDYDYELAQIFSIHGPTEWKDGLDVLRAPLLNVLPVPQPNETSNFDDVAQISCTLMWFLTRCTDWFEGSIKEYTYSRAGQAQKITTFRPRWKAVTPKGFIAVLLKMYNAQVTLNPDFDDQTPATAISGGPYTKFCIEMIVLMMLLQKRVSDHCPVPTLAGRDGSNATVWWPQAFANPGLPGLKVPPAMADYVNSFGLVVQSGVPIFPYLPNDSLTDPTRASPLFISLYGPAFYKDGGSSQTRFPFSCTDSNITPPSFVIGSEKIDVPFLATYSSDWNTLGFCSVWPLPSLDSIVMFMQQCYGAVGNISANMIVMESNCAYGAMWQMLTQGKFQETHDNIIVANGVSFARHRKGDKKQVICAPTGEAEREQSKLQIEKKDGKGVGVPLAWDILVTEDAFKEIQSSVPLSAEEVIKAFTLGSKSVRLQDAAQVAHALKTSDTNMAENFLGSAMGTSFTINATDPGTDMDAGAMVTRAGITVYKKPDLDETTGAKQYACIVCLAGNAFKTYVSPVACEAVDFGLSYIPFVGPFLRGNTKNLCKTGIDKVYNYMAGRCTVTSAESQAAKTVSPRPGVDGIIKEVLAIAATAGISTTSPVLGSLVQAIRTLHAVTYKSSR